MGETRNGNNKKRTVGFVDIQESWWLRVRKGKQIFLLVALIAVGLSILLLSRQWPTARLLICRMFNSNSVVLNPNPQTPADKIVNGAKKEVINKVSYKAAYEQIPYPNGDVKSDHGACSDVVVRALRNAGYDLQRLMHEDMKAHFRAYPHNWGLTSTDSNIDHRRVPNQMAFFRRHGQELPTGTTGEDLNTWKPGDIVCWKYDGRLDHTGIISDVKGKSGLPMVIHNLGRTAQEDCLNSWEITGHFRYPAH